MNGYDIDGVLTAGVVPVEPWIAVSGRTWAERNELTDELERQGRLFLRGDGVYGDAHDAGLFKARICREQAISDFWEDDPYQAVLIRQGSPTTTVHLVR